MKSFQKTQLELTQHLRAPQMYPAPEGVDERRLAIYRELIFNNIEGFISGAFPVLRSLFEEPQWNALIRDFMLTHSCQTPYFLQISQEFLQYLSSERQPQPADFPFLQALAHYEWVELALDIAQETIPPIQTFPDAPLSMKARVSPLVLGLHYEYPVHKIAPQFIPQVKQPSSLLVYRNRKDQVRFMEANPLTLRFVFIMQQADTAEVASIVAQLAAELHHPKPELLTQQALEIMRTLFDLDILSHFE